MKLLFKIFLLLSLIFMGANGYANTHHAKKYVQAQHDSTLRFEKLQNIAVNTAIPVSTTTHYTTFAGKEHRRLYAEETDEDENHVLAIVKRKVVADYREYFSKYYPLATREVISDTQVKCHGHIERESFYTTDRCIIFQIFRV